MYQGYLLKMENVIIPKHFIQAESYQVSRVREPLTEFEDGESTTHRIYSGRDKYNIEFYTQELKQADYKALMDCLSKYSVTAEYYNPKTGDYHTGLFYGGKDITEEIYIRKNGEVYIKEVQILLEGC